MAQSFLKVLTPSKSMTNHTSFFFFNVWN
jgi:hypothetical protein